ncbi:MAG: hypothetical protein KBD29_04590 [Candidatus Magasanikbacteria bacterium]|nr:hypothetical protein [Candidatus Magasanikbacteria bacterium]
MSWEGRKQEWKNNPPEPEKVDEWFDSLTSDERFEAFFDSVRFKSIVDKLQKYLHVFFEDTKSMKFCYEPTPRLISYCLGKIVLKTPEFRDATQNNQDVGKLLLEQESSIMLRMYAICTYESEKKSGIPEFVYNLTLPWKWEDKASEILGY